MDELVPIQKSGKVSGGRQQKVGDVGQSGPS